MRVEIIKIGNSKGIRIPAAVLKQCGFGSNVEMEVRYNNIILKPVRPPRDGWAEAFQAMVQQNDDQILVSDELDTDLLEEWDND
ncbi:MAG TPA: AbrB/MazE/SpoVT family DNA-binding domain-containing protein [Patescibacteria group bacterium]|nr:AbrB/MazE/SpoVT family DNA-binding domain-containing protein [Patescibacteria group bacterium]